MPPERSATSFAEAQALGLPLSSHGAKHAPSIARGLACTTCRRRKLKCDGVKPSCGACKKSAAIHGDDPNGLVCSYDDPAQPKRKRASPGSKVAALEAEIAELKAMLQQSRLASPPVASEPMATSSFGSILPPSDEVGMAGPRVPPAGDFASNPFSSAPPPDLGFLSSAATFLPSTSSYAPSTPYYHMPTGLGSPRLGGSLPSSTSKVWCPVSTQMPDLSPPATQTSSNETSPPFTPPSNPLFELFYPGWPRDLPSPELTARLVDVYFARPHLCSGMINAAKFRAAMMLPPTSANFPHPALLHVICAIACLMVPEEFFRGEERYWRGSEKPADYHAARCKVALDTNLGQGVQLFQIAQVFSLLCYYLYTEARWVELWLTCGQATRVSTPLGLNHLRAATDTPKDRPAHYKGTLMPETDDDEQLTEQAYTLFAAVMADVFASASTGWARSLDDVDITTVIPGCIPGRRYPRGEDITPSPNSLHNSAFFIAHPPHLCGPLQLFLKGVLLLGKVTQFQQRAPHASRTSGAGYALNDTISDLRSADAFKRLDATVHGFLASIPREFQFQHRTPGSGAQDILTESRLCLTHGMAHVSNILLHEPYVSTLEEDEPSLRQCVESANAILQSIFLILGTSYEIALFSPYITFCWACTGRTFVRQLAIKQVKGITYGVEQLRSNVETILAVLKAHRTPLGDNTHAQLSTLFADPLRCLPRPFLALANISVPGPTVVNHMSGCDMLYASAAPESAVPAPVSGAYLTPVPPAQDDTARFFELEADADALLREMNAGVVPQGIAALHGLAARMDAATAKTEVEAAAAPVAGGPGAATDWYTRQGLAGLEQLLQMQ